MADTTDKFRKAFNSTNPVTTYVTSSRSSGATTLSCNNLTGWPTDTAVDFVTYQLATDGRSPVPETQIDWKGVVSGSTITDLTWVAGATDTGNAVNDVVEAMPTASWGNDLVTGILNIADQDATLKAGAVDNAAVLASNVVSTAKIQDGAVTSSKVAAGFPVQMVSASFTGVSTTTSPMIDDDTLPQNTEGGEFMTLSITPKSATNVLVIEGQVYGATNSAAYLFAGLFKDSGADALAATALYSAEVDAMKTWPISHTMVAGSTSAMTFKVRAGRGGAGTFTFNGNAGARKLGASTKSTLRITEYKA